MRKATIIVVLAVLLWTLLSGCMAVQPAQSVAEEPELRMVTIGLAQTLNGMKSVINGTPGSFLMQMKDFIMFAWPNGSNYAISLISRSGSPIEDLSKMGLGQAINTLSFAELVKALESAGWKMITTADLPSKVVAALKTQAGWISRWGAYMPTVILAPVSFFTTPVVPITGEVIKS